MIITAEANTPHCAAIPDFAQQGINLASARLGARAVQCSNDSFASMERMLQDHSPQFKEDVYDDFGKWMDGWETRRRRKGGHDWCIIRLAGRGEIFGFDLDTTHFTGNFPQAASIWACDDAKINDEHSKWREICPPTALTGNRHHYLPVTQNGPWRWLKINIFPDGGIARLRVYGVFTPDFSTISQNETVELSALFYGGRIVAYNDAHYGNVWAVLDQGRGRNMGDGWETRRRRSPGNDWLIIALGAAGIVAHIEIDTAHFKGNYPDRCSLQAGMAAHHVKQSLIAESMFWPSLMPEQKLQADAIHQFPTEAICDCGVVNHVKLNIFPDGGISRVRIFARKA